MPPSRSKYSRCIGFEEGSTKKATKPRQPKKVLTEEEKEEAKVMKMARKGHALIIKDWEATLVPWIVNTNFRFPLGTLAMYKSDAKFAYNVTEKEILTLRHECIPRSAKTFFAQEDVKELARRKFLAGAMRMGILYDQVEGDRMLFKKTGDSNVSRRKNFHEYRTTTVDAIMKNRAGMVGGKRVD